MMLFTRFSQRIARSPGDPKVISKGPSSLTGADRLAQALAYFSFGLGLAELVMPGRITRAIGLEGKDGLVRAYGLRELAAGVPTFSIDKQVGLLMRILGDGVDLATLAPALSGENPKQRGAFIALASVVLVTALDVVAVATTSAEHRRTPPPPRDYSDRSGLPLGIEASRGIARREFHIPPDLRAPGTVAESLPDDAATQTVS